MSFDIFLQRFDGPLTDADKVALNAIIRSFAPASGRAFSRFETADGGADVYGEDDLANGMMINHAQGTLIWDVIVRIAQAGRFAIMPVGCPTCLTDPALAATLPSEIASDTRVVSTGRDLLAVITHS